MRHSDALGALVLGWSIALRDASRPRVLVVTSQVPESTQNLCRENGWDVRLVEKIPEPWFDSKEKCKWRTKSGMNQRVRWGRMATKLKMWDMGQYERVFYMDADTIATGDLARDAFRNPLFSPPSVELVGEGGTGHKFVNAGVLLLRPSKAAFSNIMAHAKHSPPPGYFRNLVDCTEMAIINSYFKRPMPLKTLLLHAKGESLTSRHATIKPSARMDYASSVTLYTDADQKLSIGRPDVRRDYAKHAPLVVHFLRVDRCAKPWTLHAGTPQFLNLANCDPAPFFIWSALALANGISEDILRANE